ncbi:MAG: ADP-ribosylglycohydrolase family protein [Ruminococcus sp.]|nr:ADP-ribosylglycohydrolase family protein [Ruminococcus sp.]
MKRFLGSMLGGAVGDALGYAVEFKGINEIRQIYGENGISDYKLTDGVALISDDTQMTLFTANGILYAETRGRLRGILGDYYIYIADSYNDWLRTQGYKAKDRPVTSWILNDKRLHSLRAPGNTCLSALSDDRIGTVENHINTSKGCGGVMRVAPVGLYFGKSNMPIERIARIGADAAGITHGHELGYIPAALLAHIIASIIRNGVTALIDIIKNSLSEIEKLFGNEKHIDELYDIVNKAISLSQSDVDTFSAIEELGEGWVAEETIAIAVYCALKYESNFEKAICAAVNHSGDSDSTGAVCGNILGAYLGIDAIPQKYLEKLELKDLIEEITADLYNGCKMDSYSDYQDEVWLNKYVK